MKIGIFTDTHYCEIETLDQDRKPRRAYDAVKTAFDEFKKQSVEAVVCLGDFAHFNNGFDESKAHLKKLSELVNSYHIPTYHCMGNHDSEIVDGDEFERISGFSVAPMAAEYDDVKMIFLDASFTPDGKAYEREYVDWTQSYVPKKELEWLERELECEKRCVVFIHQCLDTTVEKHHIVSNAQEVNEILSKHRVTHVYQGHYHVGAESIINGIPYTTVRAMCIADETNYIIAEV